jgi:hypothetical protein
MSRAGGKACEEEAAEQEEGKERKQERNSRRQVQNAELRKSGNRLVRRLRTHAARLGLVVKERKREEEEREKNMGAEKSERYWTASRQSFLDLLDPSWRTSGTSKRWRVANFGVGKPQ